jgi:hypothetical protein
MTDDSRVERVLRAAFAERVAGLEPPADLEHRVHHRHRIRVRLLVAAAAAGAVLVGVGVPAGLTTLRADAPPAAPTPGPPGPPRPSWSPPGPLPAGDPCIPVDDNLPPPVPADRLPRQTGVRGSLAADESLVDAALAAGWRGLRRKWLTGPPLTLDAGTLRVQFVERAGEGVLALVVASDADGRSRAAEWVVGRGRQLVPAGGTQGEAQDDGSARERGELYWGDDPLYVSSRQVCGRTFGVVLAPPDAAVQVAPAPRIGADTRPIYPPRAPLSLVGGLAVFPTAGPATTRVTLSQGRVTLASRVLNGTPGGFDPTALVSYADITRAVRAGGGAPDASLAKFLAEDAAAGLTTATADEVTGVRVPWGGPASGGRRVALVALTLPSGAAYVSAAIGTGASYGGFYQGLLPAGGLDGAVLAWQAEGLLTVVAPAAVRAEILLGNGTVLPVRLAGGGATVTVPGDVAAVQAYRADGGLLGRRAPGTGLVPLPQAG